MIKLHFSVVDVGSKRILLSNDRELSAADTRQSGYVNLSISFFVTEFTVQPVIKFAH